MIRSGAPPGPVRRLPAEAATALAGLRVAGLRPVPPHRVAQIAVAAARFRTGALLAVPAVRFGDAPALVDDDGPISYRELDRLADGVARGWRSEGVGENSGVGVLCRNHRGFLVALGAATKVGARVVLLNTDFAGPQLGAVCRAEGIGLLVHDDEFTDRLGHLPPGTATVESASGATTPGSHRTLGSIASAHPTGRVPAVRRAAKLVLLTSGTTGTPKGANRGRPTSLVAGSALLSMPIQAREVTYVAPPFFHAWGLGHLLLGLAIGSTIITSSRFDADAVLHAVARHRATMLVVVPTMLRRLLDADVDADEVDLGALRIIASSGSQLEGAVATATLNRFGDVLYNFYGSTEVASVALGLPADLRAAPGCAGRPPRGVHVAILDDAGQPVPAGATGRIFVANGAGFAGYTGGGTKQVIQGMMSTGDVGHFDAAGRLFVDGRDDEMIVSGGENVFPREVEELLAAHPAIVEAAVVGVADAEHGQRLAAHVVSRPGADLSGDDIRTYVRENLARFKVPRDVVFVEALPRNPAGKVLKRALAEAGPGAGS